MKHKFTFIVFVLAFLAVGLLAQAQSGGLDATFDSDGRNTTDFFADADIATAVAIQSDSKIVVAGYAQTGTNNDIAVARFNTDGSLDITFDSDGKLSTAIGTSNEIATSVAIQLDGKIVLAGNTFDGSYWDFAIVRYNPNGSLDNTFDSDGIVTTDLGGFNDYANAVIIQSDGKIVVTGSSNNLFYDDFAIARYNTDGSLDSTFGGDGKVSTDFMGYSEQIYSAVVQPDGKIVVVGKSMDLTGSIDFALARYNSDGSLDNTFNTDGKLTTDFAGTDDYGQAITLDYYGKIVVAGGIYYGSDWNFGLARYNNDGSLDNSFDTDGKLTTDFGFGFDLAHSVFVQPDDKIVAVGYSNGGVNYNFALARYNYDGSLDNTWGTGGMVTTAFGLANDQAYASLIQPDYRIVAVGATYTGTNSDFAISRYDNSISTSSNFPDHKTSEIKICPNPLLTQTTLKTFINLKDAKLMIYNSSGQLVEQITNINGQSFTLYRKKLPCGLYFIHLKQDNKTIAEDKIIITD